METAPRNCRFLSLVVVELVLKKSAEKLPAILACAVERVPLRAGREYGQLRELPTLISSRSGAYEMGSQSKSEEKGAFWSFRSKCCSGPTETSERGRKTQRKTRKMPEKADFLQKKAGHLGPLFVAVVAELTMK